MMVGLMTEIKELCR